MIVRPAADKPKTTSNRLLIAIRICGISSPISFVHVLACYKPSDHSNTQEWLKDFSSEPPLN